MQEQRVWTTPESRRASSEAALSPGDRLGPYEILEPLGSGGMGEVYRARDDRLRRDVAVKVLRRSLAVAPEHVAMLGREASAAGSLNHPNILAVFDVGAAGGVAYVVSELLEGESLRARMARGSLTYLKALEYGIQIAQALGAAHEKGIWHRDVKPENVFITADGRVKLLDFGLATLRKAEAPADTESPTEPEVHLDSEDSTAEATRPGTLRGTLAYMSPEQVAGRTVDHRADIFALGAVLYEMFTGMLAFHRASAGETMAAVLNEEPVDSLELNPGLPPAAAAVVRRCLEKNREERFQSARDLAFHLGQLYEVAKAGPRPVTRALLGRRALAAVLAAAVLAGGAELLRRWLQVPPPPTFEQLSFRRGRIGGARFASEGQAVVYSAADEGRPGEVWRLDLPDSPESRSLGHVGADVLAARAGGLALSLRRRFAVGERFVGTLAVVPIGGGSPREIADDVEDADWDPSGTKMAVVLSAAGPGAESRLEYPIGHTLHKTSGSIRFPRVSRDGQRIAFLEDPVGLGTGGRVSVVDLERTVTPLTDDWKSARGLAWSPTGDEIWFTAAEGRTNRALYAVDLQRRQRRVLQTPASLTLWDVAPDGRVLITRDEERMAVVGVPPGESSERDLSWFDTAGLADVSPDGRYLLFGDRFGVYIRITDGSSPPVNLGLKEGFADDLSPDGRWALATTPDTSRLVLLPTGPGESRPLPAGGITAYRGALWFPDGHRVLFNGAEPGHALRAYVQGVLGSAPVLPRVLTPENTRALSISPDGEWIAGIGPQPGVWLWPVGEGTPRRLEGSQPGERPVAWSADGRRLWLFRRGEVPAHVFQLELATGRRSLWRTLVPPDSVGVYSIINFQVTPDGRAYFYSYARALSQLYVARGIH